MEAKNSTQLDRVEDETDEDHRTRVERDKQRWEAYEAWMILIGESMGNVGTDDGANAATSSPVEMVLPRSGRCDPQ